MSFKGINGLGGRLGRTRRLMDASTDHEVAWQVVALANDGRARIWYEASATQPTKVTIEIGRSASAFGASEAA